MTKKTIRNHHKSPIKLASSLIALTAGLNSYQSFAQDSEQNALLEEEVIVRGTRMNLQNARDIKRDADTFVDAISAQDIGTLPDRSVLEAIQRLPGVAIERFAGPDDPDHFSVEGSGAIIRGMTQTRSEFNGRDSFTANSGRGLSFQDVPPELMGKVEIFKNQTPDMIEGGIGGTVALHTRKPFDNENRQMAFTLDYSYGDIAKEASPTMSGLFSDRWETALGEFGFLINLADSSLVGESHGIQSDAYVEYLAANIPGAERFVGDGSGTVGMPNGANALIKTDDRERKGLALSTQWANPGDTMLVTVDYIRSDAELSWHEQAIKYQGGFGSINSRESTILDSGDPENPNVAVFNDQGLFEAGTLVWGGPTHNGWRVSGVNLDHVSRSYGTNALPQFGHKIQSESRVQDTHNLIEDISLNIKWNPSDALELAADFQHIQAETDVDDLSISLGTFAGFDYDTRKDTPTVTYIEPWLGARDADRAAGGNAFELYPNGDPSFPEGYVGFVNDSAGDSNYFQDTHSYFWRSSLDKYERSEGESNAFTLDGTYRFEDPGLIKSIKTGIRYAKREQIIRDTGYDWNSLAPEWSSFRAGWIEDEMYASQRNDVEYVDWSDFHNGNSVTIPGNRTIAAKESFIRDIMAARRTPIISGGGGWEDYADYTINQAGGNGSVYDRFEDRHIYETTETNNAFYVRLDFSGDDELVYSGNIGFRYVELTRDASGFVSFPDLLPSNLPPEALGSTIDAQEVINYVTSIALDDKPAGTAPSSQQMRAWLDDQTNAWATEESNYLPEASRAYGNNAAEILSSKTDYKMFLPSFNIKLELTDNLISRFAVAKAVALPDIGDVRNNLSFGARSIETTRITPSVDENGNEIPRAPIDQLIQSANVTGWIGSGGNPGLEPMESIQYDVALEWYFSDVGQLTGTIFHKNLRNYFIQGAYLQPYTNPTTNTTAPVDISSKVNGAAAKMDGFELSYQQEFEGLFEGFIFQGTYTYIDASGVPNSEITAEELEALEQAGIEDNWVNDGAVDPNNRVSLDIIPLQGQSKQTVNLVGIYEKEGWSARLAYNWRSKYLLTTRDVISKSPLFYDNHGQLDGSFFYDVSEQITVGVQGTNLTNSQSETIMQLNNEGLTTGRSWFVSDRRLSFVVKGNF